MNKIISLDDVSVMINSFKSDLGALSQISSKKRPAETNINISSNNSLSTEIDNASIADNESNYRRFSTRKKSRTAPNREQLIDFIKTKLDAPLYNQYMNSLTKQNFEKTLEVIEDIMYQIRAISENSNVKFVMTKKQMRNYLLEPISEATERGNQDAAQVMLLANTTEFSASNYNLSNKRGGGK